MATRTRTSDSSHKAKKNLWRKFSKLAIKAESEVKVTGEHLGKGAFAEVIALEIDGVRCAGKKLHNVLLDEASETEREALTDSFAEECIRMSELRHPNIVQLLGIHIDESNTIILLMEYMPMCLTDCLEKFPKLPDFMKTSILLDIARGLLYLHRQTPPIIHRDLSTNNVLLSPALQAKICDLGVARKLKKKEPTSEFVLMSLAPGNPLHMPPEALKSSKEDGKAEYNIKLDCFSFGHVILEVVHQQSPLMLMIEMDPDNPDKPVENEVKRRSYYLQMMTDHPLHSLATRCLHNEPALRPSSVQIVKELKKVIQAHPPPIDFRNPVVMYQLFQEASQTISKLEKEVAKLQHQAQMQASERNQADTRVSNLESEMEQHIKAWQIENSVSKGEDNTPMESRMDTKTTEQTDVAMWTHSGENEEDGPIPQSQQLPEATQSVVPSKPGTKQPLGPQRSVPASTVTKQPPVPRPKPRTVKSKSSESPPPSSPVIQSHAEKTVPTSTVTNQPPVPRPRTENAKRSTHASASPPPSSPVHQSHSEQTSAVKKQPPVPRPKPPLRAASAASISPPSSSPVHQSHSKEPSHYGGGVIGYTVAQPNAQATPHQDSTTTPPSQLQLSDVARPDPEASSHITYGTEEGENRSAEELEGLQDLMQGMKMRKWMGEKSCSLECEPTPAVSELERKLSAQKIKADKGNPGEGYEQLERKRLNKTTSLDEPSDIDPKLKEMLDRRWHRIPSEDQN